MDILEKYRQIIQEILREYAKIPYAYGELQTQTVFDRDNDHYLLVIIGRDGVKRVHGCLVHIDIINNKIWIQRDGTEDGIATYLMEAGVSKDRIVLGFRSPDIRKYTEFAVE
ncbi:XisI protein [Candidatus Poribacteria bacterium]|nr:XisI protein [Candidatus Poribacteria bacterium]